MARTHYIAFECAVLPQTSTADAVQLFPTIVVCCHSFRHVPVSKRNSVAVTLHSPLLVHNPDELLPAVAVARGCSLLLLRLGSQGAGLQCGHSNGGKQGSSILQAAVQGEGKFKRKC
jgi:hypothetical protein